MTINTQQYGDRFGHNVFTKKEQGVAEGYDNYEFHTSVEKGKFLPSKFGNKRFAYLHDLEKTSPSTGGPQLVTIDDADTAKQIASQFGGKVVKTDLNTYRIVKPAEQDVTEGKDNLESLRAKAKQISDKIDSIVQSGGRVGLDDPLSRQLKAIRNKIKQAKQGVAEDSVKVGDRVHHNEYGKGVVRSVSKDGKIIGVRYKNTYACSHSLTKPVFLKWKQNKQKILVNVYSKKPYQTLPNSECRGVRTGLS